MFWKKGVLNIFKTNSKQSGAKAEFLRNNSGN